LSQSYTETKAVKCSSLSQSQSELEPPPAILVDGVGHQDIEGEEERKTRRGRKKGHRRTPSATLPPPVSGPLPERNAKDEEPEIVAVEEREPERNVKGEEPEMVAVEEREPQRERESNGEEPERNAKDEEPEMRVEDVQLERNEKDEVQEKTGEGELPEDNATEPRESIQGEEDVSEASVESCEQQKRVTQTQAPESVAAGEQSSVEEACVDEPRNDQEGDVEVATVSEVGDTVDQS
jgi:hypothetical protein